MRRLGAMLLLCTACAADMAVLVRSPYEPVTDLYAPVNAAETGQVAFRDAVIFGTAGRPIGEKLMFDACHGPYRLESEDSDRSRMGDWKLARFTCVNGDPNGAAKRLRAAVLERIHAITGCPPEYVTPLGSTPRGLRVLACQERYICTLETPSVCSVEADPTGEGRK